MVGATPESSVAVVVTDGAVTYQPEAGAAGDRVAEDSTGAVVSAATGTEIVLVVSTLPAVSVER